MPHQENLYTHPPLNIDRHIVQTAGRLKNQTHPTNALLLLLSIQVSKYIQVFLYRSVSKYHSIIQGSKYFQVFLYQPSISAPPEGPRTLLKYVGLSVRWGVQL